MVKLASDTTMQTVLDALPGDHPHLLFSATDDLMRNRVVIQAHGLPPDTTECRVHLSYEVLRRARHPRLVVEEAVTRLLRTYAEICEAEEIYRAACERERQIEEIARELVSRSNPNPRTHDLTNPGHTHGQSAWHVTFVNEWRLTYDNEWRKNSWAKSTSA